MYFENLTELLFLFSQNPTTKLEDEIFQEVYSLILLSQIDSKIVRTAEVQFKGGIK